MKENVITLKDIKEAIETQVKASTEPMVAKLSEMEGSIEKASKKEVDFEAYNARVVTATIQAITDRHNGNVSGSHAEAVKNIITERYGKKDPAFVKDFENRYKDLMATGNGGELIVEEYAQGFLDQLWDETILPKLGIRFAPTKTGNLRISKIVEGVAAGYINEGGTIDTSTLKFGHIRLSVKKAMALVPISNDLIRYANLNAEALVVEQIRKELAQLADWAFLYGTGGEFEPTGISNTEGVQRVAATPAPSYDLGLKMLNMLGKKNHSIDDAWFVMGWDTYYKLQTERTVGGDLINKAELDNGRFAGRPFIVTGKVANDGDAEDLFLLKTDEVVAIQGLNLDIKNSAEATIHTKEGMLSAFGQDYTIVRAIVEHDFKLAYGHAAVIAKVDVK